MLEALPAVSVRAGLIQQEIVSRLKIALPGAIDAFNAREGYVGLQAVRQPKRYAPAPSVLSDDWANAVLVGLAVQTADLAGGVFQHFLVVTIFSLGDKWAAGDENAMRRVFERGELIQGVLAHYLKCCINADGVSLWRNLKPTGMEAMPEGFGDDYAGVAITYSLRATPNANAR